MPLTQPHFCAGRDEALEALQAKQQAQLPAGRNRRGRSVAAAVRWLGLRLPQDKIPFELISIRRSCSALAGPETGPVVPAQAGKPPPGTGFGREIPSR